MGIGIAVLTALLTFISPCVLPLLPIYISYFAGASGDETVEIGDGINDEVQAAQVKTNRKKGRLRTLINTLGFCVGISLFFLVVFTTISFVGFQFTAFIDDYKDKIYVVCGIILILLGLKFMGYLNLPFLNMTVNVSTKTDNVNIINAFILGLVLSLSMGACAMGLIFTNLVPILTSDNFFEGLIVGVFFTLTLDILFIACAMLIDQLKGMFNFIKKHYRIINLVSGILLLVFGIITALGFLDPIIAALS